MLYLPSQTTSSATTHENKKEYKKVMRASWGWVSQNDAPLSHRTYRPAP